MEVLDTKDVIGVSPAANAGQRLTHYAGYRLPTLLARIKALVIDSVVILAIFTATTLLIDAFGGVPGSVRGFILVFMVYLYDPLLTSFFGGTLGHRAIDLTVRSYKVPAKNISLGRAFVRFLTKGLLGWLSFLTVTANPRKRAIHDLVSGSIVLMRKKTG